MKKWTPIHLFFLGTILIFGSCKKASQLDFMRNEIIKTGHIPYLIPLEHSGPGTLLGGAPDSLQVVAAPETCFPPTIDGVNTDLRRYDRTSLPKRSYHFSLKGEANVQMMDFMQTGNGFIKIGTNFSVVKGIELDMQGVHLEYFDSVKLTEYYRDSMSSICKDYLDKVGFIIQALRVDRLVFEFKKASGQSYNFALQNLENVVDIDASVNWRIENNTRLVIDTPKYVGYQIGSLRRKEEGMVLYRASAVSKNRYLFKPLAMFLDEIGGQDDDGNPHPEPTLPPQPAPDAGAFTEVDPLSYTRQHGTYYKLPKGFQGMAGKSSINFLHR